MGKTYKEKKSSSNKSVELTRLLRKINQGGDPKILRQEASRLVANICPTDIATAEQNLINDGYPAQLAQQLSAAFMLMGVLQEQNINLRAKVPANHILRIVLAEHELTRCFIAELEDVTQAIDQKEDFNDTCMEFRKLSHIIEHLDAMEEHIEREDDVIFPCLKQHGWTSLCRSAQSDHSYIKIAINDLIRLLGSFRETKIDAFKVRLNSISKYLCPIMRDHMLQEESILYPIAFEVIQDEKVWKKIKDFCDEIGYCGFHM